MINKDKMMTINYVGVNFLSNNGLTISDRQWVRNITEFEDRKGFDAWLDSVTGRAIHHLRIGNHDVRMSNTGLVCGLGLYASYERIDYTRLRPEDLLGRSSAMKFLLPIILRIQRTMDMTFLRLAMYDECAILLERHRSVDPRLLVGKNTDLMDRIAAGYQNILEEVTK